jgi:uncharacterized protein (DUF1501 family)
MGRGRDDVLKEWVERDLTDDVARGRVARAFGVEPALEQLRDALDAGQNPVVVGSSTSSKRARARSTIASFNFSTRGPS